MYTLRDNSSMRRIICPHYIGEGIWGIEKNRRQQENNEKTEAKKWWQELLVKVFTRTSTKKSAEEILKTELDNLNIQWKNIKKWTPYWIIAEEYRLFMRDIFDEKWNYKSSAADSIRALSKAIWIDGKTNAEDLVKMSERAKKFREENPITKYSDKIIDYCIEHPQQAKLGVNIVNWGYNLKDELKKINLIGWDELKEYKAFLESILYIVETREFDKYTGKIDTRWIPQEELTMYKAALRDVLSTTVKTWITQKPDSILERYKLTQEQLKKEALEYEKKIRLEINLESLWKIFENWKSSSDIQLQIKNLRNKYIGDNKNETYNKYASFILPRMVDVIAMMATAEMAAKDNVLNGSTLSGMWQWRTREDYILAVEEALNISARDKKSSPVAFSSQKWGYTAITQESLFSSPESINKNAWNQLMWTTYWEATLREQWKEKLWAIGEYILKTKNTNLLKVDSPPWRWGEILRFFQKEAEWHITAKIDEKINRDYSMKLYEKMKSDLPGISLEKFIKLWEDWVFSGRELYNIIGFDNPNWYIGFEQKLQKILNEIDQELKESLRIARQNNTYKTAWDIEKIIQWKDKSFDIKKLLQIREYQNIDTLTVEQAKKLLTLIWKYPDLFPAGNTLQPLLETIIKRWTNTRNIAGSKGREVAVTKNGMKAVKSVEKWEFENTETELGNAYLADQEKKEQLQYLSEDKDFSALLGKYWYTVKMLENPAHVQNLFKKISALPESQEKEKLLAYIENLKNSQERQLRSYARVIEGNSESDAIDYISTVSWKQESRESIRAYKFMNEHVIENVEYPKSPVSYEISQLNIGESKSFSEILDSDTAFTSSYQLVAISPDSYTIRWKNGSAIVEWLTATESEEYIDDMALLDRVWLDSLFPYIKNIKDVLRTRQDIATSTDGEKSIIEQKKLLSSIYEWLFWERIPTLNINDITRAFYSKITDLSNKKTEMNMLLKNVWILNNEWNITSQTAVKEFFEKQTST